MSGIDWTLDDKPFATLPTHELPMLSAGLGVVVSSVEGWIEPDEPHAVLAGDHRMLSRFQVKVDGVTPRFVERQAIDRSRDVFVYEVGAPSGAVLPLRIERCIQYGAHDGEALVVVLHTIIFTNTSNADTIVNLDCQVDADFVGVMSVRNPKSVENAPDVKQTTGKGFIEYTAPSIGRTTRVVLDGASVHPARRELSVRSKVLSAGETEFTVAASFGDAAVEVGSAQRTPAFKAESSNADFDAWLQRSYGDLDALVMHGAVLGAGLPWYYAPFGRDTCLALLMMGEFAPAQWALGSLRYLASRQGREYVSETNEEPGRIPHEVRLVDVSSLSLDAGNANYFGIDGTALWLLAVLESYDNGLLSAADLEEFRPNIDAAVGWITETLKREDGLVRYKRSGAKGPVNQGWKDSAGSICKADGTPSEGEIAAD